MVRHIRLVFAFSASACLLPATQTKTWIQNDYSDFDKGNLKRISLSSDGRLALAPQFREVFDSASVYLWALASDSKGNLYAAGGGPGGPGARVYVIPPDGKGKTLAELNDLEVHALAVDKQDRVYAATAPDGKVYRIAGGGKPEVFFDPHVKYIWAMAFDSKGNLFVATGDHGEIYRVAPNGTGAVFYKTSQAHIRSMAIDAQDNVVAGTEPDGLVIRVAPDGKGFVLYQTPKREVTSVALAKDGSIYASAIGNKLPAPTPPAVPAAPPAPSVPMIPGQPQQRSGIQIPTVPAAPLPAVSGGSEVYRIDKDGFPRKVWSDARDIAYAISFDADGRPLVGTGNGGDIYRLDSDLIYTDLVSAPPAQVTCLYKAPSGAIYAATGNIGKVYQLGPGFEKDGVIESDVFDAGLFSYWGRLSFAGDANGGSITMETRSGNLERPESDWSPWAPAATLPDGGRISSPPARFIQWRATLRVSSAGDSPEVREVDVAYQARNVAPRVERIETTPANYRFAGAPALSVTPSQSITLPPLGRPVSTSTSPMLSSGDSGSATMQYAKGYIGARWAAIDEDGDSMTYTVQIRGEKETEWKPLAEGLTEKRVSFDSTAFPDGEYRLRVIASDARSNPPDQALSGELTSSRFVIDNTPPEISGLAASATAGKLRVRFKAVDALSVVTKAEMSINGGEWTMIEPATRLSDSRAEDYDVTVAKPAGVEQTIAVRVTDEYDNQSVAKTVIR
jgi:outer membrane protein assembly factor BamB